MIYQEALAYLQAHEWRGSVYTLETIRFLMNGLGNPEDKLKIVHIAGTNGKGSTLAGLSSILKTAGYRIGSYSSPEVRGYLNRFQVNGEAVSEKTFSQAIRKVAEVTEIIKEKGLAIPAVFEMELAASLVMAAEADVDIFFLEAGLGGRLDATNVIKYPLLTVITTIALDHTDILGNTLEDIASEKAGIIKPNAPLITWPHEPEISAILKEATEVAQVPYYELDPDDIIVLPRNHKGQAFRYQGKVWQTALLGDHQATNASGVITAAKWLSQNGFPLSDEEIAHGLEETFWPGRFECIASEPPVYLDGAHNEEAISALKSLIHQELPDTRPQLVMAVFKNKAVEDMLSIIADLDCDLICTSSHQMRSLPAADLMTLAKSYFPEESVHCHDQLEDAVGFALHNGQYKEPVIIFGSLSHLEPARQAVQRHLKG